ncbi:MAG: 30S ribosomal protein S1 [Alkalinema sp. CACIAM 70d]|nr:MAG: 30S ribosomal protein S1 [Alkalinema sp. CACIAM 70d]
MAQKNTQSQSAFSMADFEKALETHGYEFAKGQVVTGKAFSYENDGALIDIGGKSPAFLPVDEASVYKISDITTAIQLQEEREFLIIRDQNEDGQVTVSIRRLEERRIWEKLGDLQESKQSIQVRVLDVNKGGITVNALGLRGFIPRSHVNERDNLENLIGSTLSASVLELDRKRGKIVLSNRLASRVASLSQLEMGQLIEGTVASIKPFGAFVEFNNCTGLLHVSQISQRPVESIDSLLTVGKTLKAMIVNIDEGQGRISLSTKVLETYPGEAIEKLDQLISEADDRQERARKAVLG